MTLYFLPALKGRHLRVCTNTKSAFRAEFQHRATRHLRPDKSEIRNPKQIQNPKAPRLKTERGCLVLRFGFRSFGFVSSFGFRILGKVTIPLRNDSENPEVIFCT